MARLKITLKRQKRLTVLKTVLKKDNGPAHLCTGLFCPKLASIGEFGTRPPSIRCPRVSLVWLILSRHNTISALIDKV